MLIREPAAINPLPPLLLRIRGQAPFPAKYALANRVQHPVNVYLREDQLAGEVDGWLAREFAPHRLRQTIMDLAAAQLGEPLARPDDHGEETALKITECASSPDTGRSLGPGGLSRPEDLTTPEREVLDLLADGASNRQIARSLGISLTVQNHVSRILDKPQAADRTQAALRICVTIGSWRRTIAGKGHGLSVRGPN